MLLFLEMVQGGLLLYQAFWDIKRMEVSDWPFNLGILLAGTALYWRALEKGDYSILLENLIFGLVWFFIIFAFNLVTKGEGIGLGDAKLFFWLGLKEGFWEGTILFSLSLSLALLTVTPLLLLGKKHLKSRIPLIPFFAVGFIIKKFFL